jgi:hypothetical protein
VYQQVSEYNALGTGHFSWPVHPPVVFTDVLVLDVRSNQLARVADIQTPEPTRMPEAGTIVIAIPAHRRDEFAAASAGATMLLTRHT